MIYGFSSVWRYIVTLASPDSQEEASMYLFEFDSVRDRWLTLPVIEVAQR
jgi:hypothetical protein